MKPEPIAVCLGDVHLSEKCPAARSSERDWFAVMANYLDQVKQVKAMLGQVPVVCSGDLFHVHDPSPRLINFALDHLFTMYAVPGQHDLRNHVLADLDFTAYGTMKRVGIVIDIEPSKPQFIEGAALHGFPWGTPLTPITSGRPCLGINVAVCHRYVWTEQACHPQAQPDRHLRPTRALLDGYDTALFGDNHKTIHHDIDGLTIFNPGSFLRRNIDDEGHRPCLGVLMSDGTVRKKYLDCSADVLVRVERKVAEAEGPNGFVGELRGLEVERADYRRAVTLTAESPEVSAGVKEVMLKSVEG